MVNGLTPGFQSADDDRIRLELGTVLLALRRLRADLASGRVHRDGRLLSAEQIDKLLVALRPPESRPKPEARNPTRFCRTADAGSSAERSTSNWNALAQAVGQ
jgi:hypothetical protein